MRENSGSSVTRRTSIRLALAHGCFAALAIANSTSALAQEANEDGLTEIVVTAQKRETNLQETPIAITAISGLDLETRAITNVQALGFSTPGLVYAEAVSQQQISLRGIGSDIPNLSGEPGVAFHIDGVYMGALNDSTSAFGELERVEVLRGPQGTLYGRNATGGAVNLITKKPSFDPEGYVSLLYGNYDRIEARAGASGALSDTIAARLSYYFEDRDGYALNAATGQRVDSSNRHAVRGSLLFKPNDNFEIVLRGDYAKDRYTGIPNKPLGVGNPAAGLNEVQNLPGLGRYVRNPRIVYNDFPGEFEREIWGLSGTIGLDIGGVKLKSITAYRHSEMPLSNDADGYEVFGFHIRNTTAARQFSQELQLQSDSDGPLNWIVGAFYYDQIGDLGIFATFPGPFSPFAVDTRQKTKSYAAYGELYYELTEALKLTVGARYTSDKKSFANTFGLGNSDTFNQFTPKLGLEYKFSDDVFGYVTVGRGFKSGGFNIFEFVPPPAQPRAFQPEKVTAYEGGLKTEFLNQRVRLNVSGFFYDYKDMQVTQFPGLPAVAQFISNAASSHIYGADVELTALVTPWLKLEANTSFLHARFQRFVTADALDPTGPLRDLSGNRLIRSPDFVGNFAADITLPLGNGAKFNLRGELSYSDDYYFTVFNREPARQPSYTMINVFLNFTTADDKWKIGLFGRNLTDEAVLASAFESPKVGSYLAPRTYGLSVMRKF